MNRPNYAIGLKSFMKWFNAEDASDLRKGNFCCIGTELKCAHAIALDLVPEFAWW